MRGFKKTGFRMIIVSLDVSLNFSRLRRSLDHEAAEVQAHLDVRIVNVFVFTAI